MVEPTSTIELGANAVAHVAGMATTDVQLSGTTIVLGTTTTDEAGNETIDDVATLATTLDGTESGKLDH